MRLRSDTERGTIDAQRDFLRSFASLYDLPIAGEYADDGVSGTVLLTERPDGQCLTCLPRKPRSALA
jgi:hypothetical protein